MRLIKLYLIFLVAMSLQLIGCSDFLDDKPDLKISEPTSLEDFQALMNELYVFQTSPAEGELSADDLFLTSDKFESLGCQTEWDLYLWQDGPMNDPCYHKIGWTASYEAIYIANTVIEGLGRYTGTKNLKYNDVLGQAYLNRALHYLELAVIWTDVYSTAKADVQLGLPLRLVPDFTQKSVRSNLKETYEQVIADLLHAYEILPDITTTKMRPTKDAALAILARAYLLMGDYKNAFKYAEECLSGKELIDYNNISKSPVFPFDRLENQEMIFERYLSGKLSLYPGYYANVNRELFELYNVNDLRKELFFKIEADGNITFRGSYGGGNLANFSGASVDEVHLISAECAIRLGNSKKAMELMELFVSKRYVQNSQQLLVENLLDRIVLERRKQLIFRGLRFSDIKRYNAMGGNISLKRIIRGKDYYLAPNDPKFTLLIPWDIIKLSGMQQNIR